MCSSSLSLTSALDGGGWSVPFPRRFPPPREKYGFHCIRGPVWTGAENLPPPGIDPRTIQPVEVRYTD